MGAEHVIIVGNQRCTSRRGLLVGVGAVGLAGVLTGCGGDTEDQDNPTTMPQSVAPSGTASSSGAGTGGALAATTDIPVGGGKVVNGVLVVQPTAGTFKAYQAACPHQGVQVSAPTDGVATCPAHRSTFDINDGSRLSDPADRPPVPPVLERHRRAARTPARSR
jgi:nitrite reductase/ring-hydroxylating ferredoxin subunit